MVNGKYNCCGWGWHCPHWPGLSSNSALAPFSNWKINRDFVAVWPVAWFCHLVCGILQCRFMSRLPTHRLLLMRCILLTSFNHGDNTQIYGWERTCAESVLSRDKLCQCFWLPPRALASCTMLSADCPISPSKHSIYLLFPISCWQCLEEFCLLVLDCVVFRLEYSSLDLLSLKTGHRENTVRRFV